MKSRCPHLAHRAVWRRLACATLAVLVAACGDGGTEPEPPPPPNHAPLAGSPIPAQTLTEGQQATVNVASLFTDPDGDALSFTASTSNAGVAAATVSGSTVTITAVAAGTATITVTARDPGGLTAALSANVAVEPPNRAPLAGSPIPAQTLTEGQQATVNVASLFTDPDGDALSFTASTSNAGVAAATVSGSTVTITAVASGTATITVTARDPGGLTAALSANVAVEPPNRAPLAGSPIPAQTLTEGQQATVNVASLFTDPDGDALSFTASTSNAGVAAATVSGSTVTITAVAAGTATITVTARDPGGLTAALSANVAVEPPNRAPLAGSPIPAQTLTEGQQATVNVASLFTDPDGDALTYAATSSAAAVVSVSLSGSTLTMAGVAEGAATATVTATDPGGLSATQSFQVTVEAPNRAPEPVGMIPNQTVGAGQARTLEVSSYFRDPDGDALTYIATSSATAVAATSVSGSTLTIVGVSAGTATVMVTARDAGGLTATQSTEVTVSSDSDFVPFSGLTITENGGILLGGFSVGTGCISVGAINIGGVSYQVHWTEWQVSAGSGWNQVTGTRRDGAICGYDLTTAPPGEYRLVGELSINGVRGRYRSSNTVTVGG